MSEHTFTVEYFNEQVCEFMEACGKRSFWEADQIVRDNAIKALGYVYLRTQDANPFHFQAAIENYARRDSLISLGAP